MITRRTLVNLIAFLVVTLGLVTYGVVDLLGNPFRHPTTVSAVFPDASGITPNFGVVLDGVLVGTVTGVQLVPGGAKVEMAIQPGTTVPSGVRASIDLANDLGQQQIELVPPAGGRVATAPLRDGAVIPTVPGGVPTDVGQVVHTVSNLLSALPVGDVNTILSQGAAALAGRASAIDTLIGASRQFSSEFLAYEAQFKALLSNAPPVLDTVSSVGPALRADIAQTEVLAGVLANHRYDLVHVLDEGTAAAKVADELVLSERPNAGCLLQDFAGIFSNVGSDPVLSQLAQGIQTNQWFFGAVEGISPTGPSKSLFPGDPATSGQEWLRTRLFLPPQSPSAEQYAHPTGLPPVQPGEACHTPFGSGVGPATQESASSTGHSGGSATSQPSTSRKDEK